MCITNDLWNSEQLPKCWFISPLGVPSLASVVFTDWDISLACVSLLNCETLLLLSLRLRVFDLTDQHPWPFSPLTSDFRFSRWFTQHFFVYILAPRPPMCNLHKEIPQTIWQCPKMLKIKSFLLSLIHERTERLTNVHTHTHTHTHTHIYIYIYTWMHIIVQQMKSFEQYGSDDNLSVWNYSKIKTGEGTLASNHFRLEGIVWRANS